MDLNSSLEPAAPSETFEEDIHDEGLGIAETYHDYKPSKLTIGQKHPDPIVESSSLSSIEPPDVNISLSLPKDTIESGKLSSLQLESIVYASQQHEHFLPNKHRAGFLIGDGAGVGKGRTLAGLILDNYLKGRRKALWISISNDLMHDARRDLCDIGGETIPIHTLLGMKYEPITSKVNGYVEDGVIFSTYSSLISDNTSKFSTFRSRFDQIVQWCGNDFDGVIVFDECHRSKNIFVNNNKKSTKTAIKVVQIQNQLPNARVVYSSATGASEIRNMAYMVRLGLWGEETPFSDFDVFRRAVEMGGVSALEIVAMDMKSRGMYIARQLSFQGVSFFIDEVTLSPNFIALYDAAVKLWVTAKKYFQEAFDITQTEGRTVWALFWAAHQRFFKYLCIGAKVKHAIDITKQSLQAGKCVVIGLQSTGEAKTNEIGERLNWEFTDFISTPKEVFSGLVEKNFPKFDSSKKKVKSEKVSLPNQLNKQGKKRTKSIPKNETKRKRCQKLATSYNSNSNSPLKDFEKGKSYPESVIDLCNESFELGVESFKEGQTINKSSDTQDLDSIIIISDSEYFSEIEFVEDIVSSGHSDYPYLTMNEPDHGISHESSISSENNIGENYLKSEDLHLDSNLLESDSDSEADKIFGSPEEKVEFLKNKLLIKIDKLGKFLPLNTLDQLIDQLGGPECVAEMTGRRGRLLKENDNIQYNSRNTESIVQEMNLNEKELFMSGKKDIAIISDAASTGISLQSDKRVENKKRRVHLTLELPWSADKAVQQFGRTHRSNQVNAPEYVFLISDLAGEKRFASIIAKRLETLGALTHGDRRATETQDFSSFHISTSYGRRALNDILNAILGSENPCIPFPKDYVGNFKDDVSEALLNVDIFEKDEHADIPGFQLTKNANNIDRFLNRILGIPVQMQNSIFKYFMDTLDMIISQAIKNGSYDLGIQDLGNAENIRRIKTTKFNRKHFSGIVSVHLHALKVERGMPFDSATNLWLDLEGLSQGFYLSKNNLHKRPQAILVEAVNSVHGVPTKSNVKTQLYIVYKPHIGKQSRRWTLQEITLNYRFATIEEAKPVWESQYCLSNKMCTHVYLNDCCLNVQKGLNCEYGLREYSYYVLSGCILGLWHRIEKVVDVKAKLVRLKTNEGLKIVGRVIPKSKVSMMEKDLETDSERVEIDIGQSIIS